MNKIVFRILLILFLIFVFCMSAVNASSDISFDLPGVNNSTSTNETTNNNEVTNSSNDDTTVNSTGDDIFDNTDPNPSESLQPSSISSAPETGLGTSNVINILLIAVGVILILLAIAILIRLNG